MTLFGKTFMREKRRRDKILTHCKDPVALMEECYEDTGIHVDGIREFHDALREVFIEARGYRNWFETPH